MSRDTCQDCCCQCPHPCGKLPMTHVSSRDPPLLAGCSCSISCGVTAPFPWVLVCVRFYLCPQVWSLCFPQSCVNSVIKSCWPSRLDSFGISSSFAWFLGWEAWCGTQNLHSSWRTSLILSFSSLWVTHSPDIGFDFILIESFIPSCCGFFFFECGVSFSGEF